MPRSFHEEFPPTYDARQLPPGWFAGYDPRSGRTFYRNDLISPPKVLWVHPLDDPTYQDQCENENIPSYFERQTRPSLASLSFSTRIRPITSSSQFSASTSSSIPSPSSSSHQPSSSEPQPPRRSDSNTKSLQSKLGSFRDKLIGTKEERELAFQQRQAQALAQDRLLIERRNAAYAKRDAQMGRQPVSQDLSTWKLLTAYR